MPCSPEGINARTLDGFINAGTLKNLKSVAAKRLMGATSGTKGMRGKGGGDRQVGPGRPPGSQVLYGPRIDETIQGPHIDEIVWSEV